MKGKLNFINDKIRAFNAVFMNSCTFWFTLVVLKGEELVVVAVAAAAAVVVAAAAEVVVVVVD